jgi:hypothetical protein
LRNAILGSAALLCALVVGTTAAAPFHQSLALQGIGFRVQCPNAGSINRGTITATGLANDNAVIEREADGTVTGAEVADLDADGAPEIYVYTHSAGSGTYGGLIAYAVGERDSLSEIRLPPIEDSAEAARGYMGHDELAVVENGLVRRFPVYREGNTNAAPSGSMRQIQYKLVAGESGSVLRKDRFVEY